MGPLLTLNIAQASSTHYLSVLIVDVRPDNSESSHPNTGYETDAAMTVQRDTLLCRYHYDPLDRVASCAPLNQQSIQRFYRKGHLATEMLGQVQYSVFEHEARLLALQQHQAGRVDCALLATDLQRSVLHSVTVSQHQQPVYSPYGHRSPESGLISLLGFNGERRDLVTGHYLLGIGYRAFNPVLMRFNSPDSLSPFEDGGVNAYAYCLGDPVNRVDPSGHGPWRAAYFSSKQHAAGNAVFGAFGNTVSTPLLSVKAVGNSAVKRSAGLVSKSGSLNVSQIDALDLALPEALDHGRMRNALAVRVQAQETLDTAREQYSVLQRFAASPPRNKDGTVAVENFAPSDIVNQPAAKRLDFAMRGAADAQAVFEHVRGEYFTRYPQSFKAFVTHIRSTKRRRSI